MPSNERNRLIEENMGLVGQGIKDRVRDVRGVGIHTYDDLFQIGCLGLCRAADTYRPGKVRFSTYAYVLIRNEIFDALRIATDLVEVEGISAKEALDEAQQVAQHALDKFLSKAG